MALTARLQFGDNDARVYPDEYLVEDCQCHFTRHYDHLHPDREALCERMELTVVAPGRENQTLYEWYISGDVMTGRVLFEMPSPHSEEKVYKEVLFEGAYCFALAEEYNINQSIRRCVRLSIVAEHLVVNNINFRNLYQ